LHQVVTTQNAEKLSKKINLDFFKNWIRTKKSKLEADHGRPTTN
jgi:hypothetical protein